MKTIRIGIVGTGGMAGAHVRFFKEIPGVELTSCLDIDSARAKEFAEKHSFRGVAGNLDQLLNAVDAVSVVTADAGHAPVSLAVLKAGKHLFCEKPLTVTIDEARQVARGYAKTRQRGVIGMTNFSHRGAHFDKAQQIVARGDLGELRYVRGYYLQGWLCGLTNPGPGQVWRLASRPGADGTLGDLGCHLIDFVTGICGPAKRLRCELRNHRGRGANDTAAIQLDFANGAFGHCETTRWASGRRNEVLVEIHGTEGGLAVGHSDPSKPFLRVCSGKDLKTGSWQDLPVPPITWTWKRFIRAIRTGKTEQPDILRGAEIQAYLEACIHSAATGKWQAVPRT
jgi:predicted dehydrogenase